MPAVLPHKRPQRRGDAARLLHCLRTYKFLLGLRPLGILPQGRPLRSSLLHHFRQDRVWSGGPGGCRSRRPLTQDQADPLLSRFLRLVHRYTQQAGNQHADGNHYHQADQETEQTSPKAGSWRELLRFFAPPGSAAGNLPSSGGIPAGPWQQWFSAGTNISNGLFLAADMLQRNSVKHGSVLLISDLADDPADYAPLSNAVRLLQNQHVPLEIVALNPKQQNAEFFKNLLGAQALIQKASMPTTLRK